MAYDPYYAAQADYYQDPYQGGGYGYDEYGYGGYGYEGYGEPYNPPPPDKNWVDPAKVNREYLNKIKTNCVHKGFEGLKEEGLFLLEVTTRFVSLRKDVFDNLPPNEENEKPIMVFVKFLDVPFTEVNETETGGNKRYSGDYRTSSVSASDRKSFTNLFQAIYSSTGDHDSLVPQVEDETEERGNEELADESINKVTASESSKEETPTENGETYVEEVEKIDIMKGKSVLLPMSGLCMIQKLQQYPLIIKVTSCDVTDDGTNFEGDIIATSFIRLPETYRKAVLMSCQPATVLPLVVVTTNNHKLLDPEGWELGDVELTLVLTCFGKGAVNCVTEFENTHDYAHTFLLRHLKAKHVVVDESPDPSVDPRLAKEIVELGLFLPGRKTSSEILQHCISSNLIPTDEEERKHAQKKKKCAWFHMLKKTYPPSSSHSFDFEKYVKEMDMEIATLWRKHKQICRELKTKDAVSKTSLEERFREVQTIETGVTGIETENPFEDLACHSVSVLCLKSFNSNMSPRGNFQKGHP